MPPTRRSPRSVRRAERRSSARRSSTASAKRGAPAPLLVIAGAGTGKTMTLAARVARLVLAGADPQRMLLLTFSRRAAQEMERRAGRVLHAGAGLRARRSARRACPGPAPSTASARACCASYAGAIGLADAVHDPRPRRRRGPDGPGAPGAGPGRDHEALPAEGHLPGDLLARASTAGRRSAQVLQTSYPWCAGWEDELKQLFGAYVRGQAAAARARLRRPAAVLAADDGRAGAGRGASARASTTCWSTSTRTPTGCRPRSCWR